MVGWPGGDARREGHAEGPPACADRLMGCPPGSQQALQANSEANGSWARGKTLGTTLLESRVAARLRHAQVALTHSLKRASCVLENKVRESGAGRGVLCGWPSVGVLGPAPEKALLRGSMET